MRVQVAARMLYFVIIAQSQWQYLLMRYFVICLQFLVPI